jgi:hypothetical protein
MNIRLHNESQPFQAPKLQEKTNPHLHGKEDGEEAAASISNYISGYFEVSFEFFI